MRKTFHRIGSFSALALIVVATTCGGGGSSSSGDGNSNGTNTDSLAFVSGNVSYPSSGLTKPGTDTNSSLLSKIRVTDSSLQARNNATVHAFYYDSSGAKIDANIETITDASGNFTLRSDNPTFFADKLVQLEASFPAVTNTNMEVTIRKLVDMTSYISGSKVNVDPITEALLQQIFDLINQYGLNMTPSQYAALSVVLESMIDAATQRMAEGGFEFDESGFYSGNLDDNEGGRELGYESGSDAILSQYGVTSLMNSLASGTTDFKKSKIIELLCMMGYSVSAGSDKVYMLLPPSFFLCQYDAFLSTGWDFGQVEIDYTDVPGFSESLYGSTTKYRMAKGIFSVDPSKIFTDTKEWTLVNGADTLTAGKDNLVDVNLITTIDANGDGQLNETVYFDSWKKNFIWYKIATLPVLSQEFVAELLAHLNSTTTVDTVANSIASSFEWYSYDTPLYFNPSVEGSYISPNPIPLLNSSTGLVKSVTKTEILSYLTALNSSGNAIPDTAYGLAYDIASQDGFILYLWPDVWLDNAYKIYEMNTKNDFYNSGGAIDPFNEMAQTLVDMDTIKNFVMDKDSFSSFTINSTAYYTDRTPIWESELANIKNVVYVGIPEELLGASLTSSKSINYITALVFLRILYDKLFQITAADGWLETYTDTYDPTNTFQYVDVNWDNIKWLDQKYNVDNPMQTIFTAISAGFAPSGDTWTDDGVNALVNAYAKQLLWDWNYAAPETPINYSVWTDTLNDLVNDVTINMSAQLALAQVSGNPLPIQSTTVEIYETDWSQAWGLGTLVNTVTTDSWGVFWVGVKPNTEYMAKFTVNAENFYYLIFTDPSLGKVVVETGNAKASQLFMPDVQIDDLTGITLDLDNNGDGLYETWTFHLGVFNDDPLPGTETSLNWIRTVPYIAYPNAYFKTDLATPALNQKYPAQPQSTPKPYKKSPSGLKR